jgi:hypothetical protein
VGPLRRIGAALADQEQRERESRESDETKFDEALDREEQARHEAAERLRNEPPLEPAKD